MQLINRTRLALAVAAAVCTALALLAISGSQFAGQNPFAAEAYAAPALAAEARASTQDLDVQAAKNLKQRGLKFDLKKGKKVKFNVYHAALSDWDATSFIRVKDSRAAKITSYKVKNAKNKGYKQAAITIKYKSYWTPSDDMAYKIWLAGWGAASLKDWVYGRTYISVLDYKTGENLLAKNPYKVKAKWKCINEKDTPDYEFDDGGYISFLQEETIKVAITYPKSYKNLCLGIGGNVWTLGDDYNRGTDYVYEDDQFYESCSKKRTWLKTTYYKKGKSNWHYMRIR